MDKALIGKDAGLRVTAAVALAVVAGYVGVASAHHSFASFDFSKSMILRGTVKAFQWTNPHMYLFLLVPGAGKTNEWTIESGTPNINVRHGWRPSDIKPGDQLTVQFHPTRDGSLEGTLVWVQLADGRKLYGTGGDFVAAGAAAGASPAGVPAGAKQPQP